MDIPSERAPEWAVERWFNHDGDLRLSDLRGRVVAVEAFQMLCPGCVAHGLPQAQRIADTFDGRVVVIGLHTVFEHHDAMPPIALKAFLHEYRIGFPVGVDRRVPGHDTPETMTRYGLRGTPSLLLFDADGRLRAHHFGATPDMVIGAEIATLLRERGPEPSQLTA